MPAHLHGIYVDWSSERANWALLVLNRFLSDASFHTGDTPTWTQGDVIGEGTLVGTGKRMVLCDLGGCDMERHMEETNVRIALGPNIRAVGSEGRLGYGWHRRRHCFSLKTKHSFPDFPDYIGTPLQELGGSSGTGGASGDTVLIAEDGQGDSGATDHIAHNYDSNEVAPQPGGHPIADYDMPSDVEGIAGTQDSTARTTFPKVSQSLPEYIFASGIVEERDEDEDDALEQNSDEVDSSDRDWMPEFKDTQESSDEDFDWDDTIEGDDGGGGFANWCMRPEAFTPTYLDMEQLAQYYRKASWSSASVDFVRSRDNFTGPTPGMKQRALLRSPKLERVFNLY